MKLLNLIFRNILRHKLRTFLTILGIAIAVLAFGVLRTVVTAWHSGVDAAAADRLITRHAVSFIFPLDYAYKDQIARIPGVETVSWANWFGGVYIDKQKFFARMGVDAETYFDVYDEFQLTPEELKNFKQQRNSCVVGQDLADTYGFKIGEPIVLEGDIYPGQWEFIVRGIYQKKNKSTDGTLMVFHWDYLNENMAQNSPNRASDVGWYIVKIDDPSKAGDISERIDQQFSNSSASTKTETEVAFNQGFLAGFSAMFTAMDVMSFLIVGIIMLVLGNTMIMAARERTREYAVFKALGFTGSHLTKIIMGESLLTSLIGGLLGLGLMVLAVGAFEATLPKGWFPVFQLEPSTIILSILAVIIIGVAAAIFPIQRALSTRITEGFRFVG